MIPFIYCGTNPEQKDTAEAIMSSFSGFLPYPVYDTNSMTEAEGSAYLEKQLRPLVGMKVCVLFSRAVSGVMNILKGDGLYLLATDELVGLEIPKATVLCDNLHLAKKIPNSTVVPRLCCPTQIYKNHIWREDPSIEVRILIAGRGHSVTPYQKILTAARESFRNFKLYVEDNVFHKVHDHQRTNEDIIKLVDDPGAFSFPTKKGGDYDICVTSPFRSHLHIHDSICRDIPVLAPPNRFAKSLEESYGCLHTYGEFLPNTFEKLKSDNFHSLLKGMHEYRDLRSSGRVEKKWSAFFGQPRSLPPKINDTINIFLMARNNEDTIGKTLSTLKVAERRSNYDFRYYIFENDSSDDTPNQIRDFFEHSKGKFKCEKFDKVHWGSSPDPKRMLDLAQYRNQMKGLCETWENSSYSFILDSEIDFTPDIIDRQIALLESSGAAMVTPYGTHDYSDRYYDVYAYTSTNGDKQLPKTNNPFRAHSAFCGFVCIRTQVFKECHWDSTGPESEHISFCQMVRQYGDILVDPNTRVKWKK